MLCTPLFKIRNIYSFFVSLLLTSPSFCHFLDYSAHFHLLQFTSSFGLIIPKNVPDYSSLCDILLAYYIGFENVCCYYINLIDSKYSISSLKAFVHRVATIHKIITHLHLVKFEPKMSNLCQII